MDASVCYVSGDPTTLASTLELLIGIYHLAPRPYTDHGLWYYCSTVPSRRGRRATGTAAFVYEYGTGEFTMAHLKPTTNAYSGSWRSPCPILSIRRVSVTNEPQEHTSQEGTYSYLVLAGQQNKSAHGLAAGSGNGE